MELIIKRNAGFDNAYTITCDSQALKMSINPDEELYLEGSFFYQVKNGKTEKFSNKLIDKQLKETFLAGGIQSFTDTVEGVYSGVHLDKKNKKISIFSDKLKGQELYYYSGKDEIVVSTTLKNLRAKAGGYSPESILSILYLYAPKGNTLYNNIFRLRYNEILEIAGGNLKKMKFDEPALKIADYTEENLENFKDIIENAIISRSSDKLNVVQLSGGWDSTFLISVLSKYYSSSKIKAVIAELIADKGAYNVYEVEKSRKIARYFNIGLDVIPADFNSKELIELWKHELEEKVMDHELFDAYMFPQYFMTSYVREKHSELPALINGEGCDSMNNFGFSQYHSFNHESKGFGEYSDKMASYLYSPSFFKKVLNNTCSEDLIFRMFQWYHKDDEFINAQKLSKKDRIFEYLLSFVYSPKRVPFMQFEKTGFIKPERVTEFKEWLRKEYFKEIILNIDTDNFYYWLLRIYVDFNWQNPGNIRKVRKSSPNIRLPFIDYNIFKFYARMPERWGRGLEINNVKYPLKKIIREGGYKFPIDVVEDTGPHSYNVQAKDLNPYYLHHCPLAKYFFKKVNFGTKYKAIFPQDYFDISAMKKYVDEVKAGKEDRLSPVDFHLLNFLMQTS